MGKIALKGKSRSFDEPFNHDEPYTDYALNITETFDS